MQQNKFFINNLVRALRLPFITASVLPFVLGSLIERGDFSFIKFFLGLIAVACAHLSANLINDYADSKSRADWQDKSFYGFFGGSKLIQEGIFSEKFYFFLAVIMALISALAIACLAVILKSFFVVNIFMAVIILSWSYSAKPLQLVYRRLGELVIFILFGPVLVMAGYFLQTGIFPDLRSFALSLPIGFLVTAILYANEIPDYANDFKSGKFTLVSIWGGKQAYLFYCVLVALAFLSIAWDVSVGYINPVVTFSFLLVFIPLKAAAILKNHYDDKIKLVASSRMTIILHNIVSMILIFGVII